jgi:2-phospho-L-lactate/phosphoenolpyruvate guanylyltransferase
MSHRTVWAVVLVKPFARAKQRLAEVLDAGERAELARLMLEDVLTAIDGCRDRLAGVIVVTADAHAADIARRHQALALVEAAPVGINAAIGQAVNHLVERPGAGIVVVPADLPQLVPNDIEEMIDLIDGPRAVALVRASDGGTNLLACRPAGVIAPRFGPDSFNAHCVAAAREGMTPTVRFAPHLGLDIDRAHDLLAFISRGSATATHEYLSTLNIQARLRESGDATLPAHTEQRM